jgi:hypothetical protein
VVNPNPFRITTRFCGGKPTTSVCCSPNFTARCETTLLRFSNIALLLLGKAKVSAEIKVECDPELTAIIDAYTKSKAEDWVRESVEEGPDAD